MTLLAIILIAGPVTLIIGALAGYARGPVRSNHKLCTDPRFLIADGFAQQVSSPLHEASIAR